MSLIELRAISKLYKTNKVETKALSNIDLNIEKGDIISIMGKSGCGKSTLLNILGLISEKTSGSYIIDGINIDSFDDKKLSKIRNEKIGFIYQHFALIKEITVLENIMFPLKLRKLSKGEMIEKARTALESVGLLDQEKKFPSELSGGQQQRVAIARTIAQETAVILADEPTGNLDEETGKDIIKLLLKINKKGTAIVIVTHDKEIAKNCEKIYFLKDGKMDGLPTINFTQS